MQIKHNKACMVANKNTANIQKYQQFECFTLSKVLL